MVDSDCQMTGFLAYIFITWLWRS